MCVCRMGGIKLIDSVLLYMYSTLTITGSLGPRWILFWNYGPNNGTPF